MLLVLVVGGRLRVVVTHPSRKNKGAARVGHPVLWVVESGWLGVVVSQIPKCEGPGAPSFVGGGD